MYRVGGHWGRTIVRIGVLPPDEQGRRDDDEIIGLLDTREYAERAVAGLNEHAQAAAEGYRRAIATLLGVVEHTGSPAAKWAAGYLEVDPDRRGPIRKKAAAPEPIEHDISTFGDLGRGVRVYLRPDGSRREEPVEDA
jgi:hypothetical protein